MNRNLLLAFAVATIAVGPGAASAKENYGDIGVNAQLAASGENIRLAYAEFVGAADSDFEGMKTIFFKDVGNKQLGSHWAPGHPWNDVGVGTAVPYITDLSEGAATGGLDAATTSAAIDRGMGEWNDIGCATLPIVKFGEYNQDLGFVQFLTGFGGTSNYFPGITHGGWLPKAFFDFIGGPGGGDGILGVTFTFIWTDDDGNPTDLNADGKADVALREIYMNNNFVWEIGNDQGTGVYDIEAVMFHEQGHALSQGHFGEISLNPKGKVIISPKQGDNVMLAAISSNWKWEGFHGSDIGGHCSIWATWPLQ